MGTGGIYHTIQQGETTSSLAQKYGLFWETIWDHPENEQLRNLRKNHNVLFPGDKIFIPAVRIREESVITDKKHRFQRKGIPEKLNMQFIDLYGDPFANAPYTLIVDGKVSNGALDDQGWLRAPISPNAQQARIEIGESGELWALDLDVGHLDPVTELTGIQARLRNMGHYNGPVDGKDGEGLSRAIRFLRSIHGLEINSDIDEAFRNKLSEVYKT